MSTSVHHSKKSTMPSHTPGTTRADRQIQKPGAEPGRETGKRTARDSTGINAADRDPIDPRMPHMPPA